MNIPDEAARRYLANEPAHHARQHSVTFVAGAEWALREAADKLSAMSLVRIPRLELVAWLRALVEGVLMDSSNAEKAWVEYRESPTASAAVGKTQLRDAALKALAESRARFGDSEARRAELEAVIEKVRALCHTMDRGVGYRVSGDHSTWGEYHEGKSDFSGEVEELLDTTRSVVLEDRDREIAARAVEGVVSMLETGSTNPDGKYGSLNEGSRSQWFSHGLREAADRVRERAAAIRKGEA